MIQKKMARRHGVLFSIVVLLLVSALVVSGDSSFDFDLGQQNTQKHNGSYGSLLHISRLDLGRKSWKDQNRVKQKPDFTNIKTVLAAQRESKRAAHESPIDSHARFGFGTENRAASPAGILGTLSEEGLEYVKEVLVGEVLDELTPLNIADIQTRVDTPVGRVDTLLSNIVLEGAEVEYSDIALGGTGIIIYAAGITAKLSMNWKYVYTAAYIPWPIEDGGWADIVVTGMQAGIGFSLVEKNGTLRLVVDEAGSYIENLEIELHGGASWLYQWFIYAFDYNIRAAIEASLTLKISSGAETLDDWLLHLPRAVPIDDTSAIDVTVVQDPLLSPTYLSVRAKGEFVAVTTRKDYPDPNTVLPAGLFCDQSLKMLTLALSDYVLNSAAFVYYDSGELIWDVDNSSGKKYLNTKSWKYIIPQLYKKYPNDDMVITFAIAEAPIVKITKSGIRAVAGAEMTIKGKDGADTVSVACIAMTVSFDAKASLRYANVTGQATLDDLTVSVKWSDVGNFPAYLVQVTIRTIMKDVVIPILNVALGRGFPIPMVAGVEIENADLRYEDGYLLICTDVKYVGGYFFDKFSRATSLALHMSQ